MAITKVDKTLLEATGTADATTFLRGDGSWASASAGFNSIQVFTSSGTWTRPSGITKVVMEVQGAGGGGARNTAAYKAGGGAGGGCAIKVLDVSSIGTSTITVGAGGVSAGGSNTDGSAGGSTSWADGTNMITGTGGGGGSSASYGGTDGATATGGDINLQGGDGAANPQKGGGDAKWGTGGFNMQPSEISQGYGRGYGSGAGGAYNRAPYDGSGGILVVWEYK